MAASKGDQVDTTPQAGEEDAQNAGAGVRDSATSTDSKMASGKKTYKGSCHCGYVVERFDPGRLALDMLP